MAFNKVPSQLQPLFWEVTYEDIQTKLRLFIGEQQLLVNQQFQVMSQVVSLAFGSGGGSEGSRPAELVAPPKTASEALSQFKGLNL